MIYRLKLVRCGFSLLDEIIFTVKISVVQWRHEQAANSIVSSNSYNSSTWITFVSVRMSCTYLNFLLQPDGGCTEGKRRWRADWTQSTACCPWSPSSRVLLLTTYCFPVYCHQFIPSPRPNQQQQQPTCIGHRSAGLTSTRGSICWQHYSAPNVRFLHGRRARPEGVVHKATDSAIL